MADKEEGVTVDLDAAEAEEAKKRKADGGTAASPPPPPPPPPPPGDTVEEGIEDLKRKLQESQNENARLRRQAGEATQKAETAMSAIDQTNLELVTAAIERIKERDKTLKIERRAARDAGNIDAEEAADDELRMNAAKMVSLENGKRAMEEQAKQPKPTPRLAPQTQDDPAEGMATNMASQGFPRSADWIRRHPEYARDPNLTRKMLAAHNLAEADGHAADSDGYFAHINTTLKIDESRTKSNGAAPASAAAQPVQRRDAPPAAAPVTRTPPAGRRLTLTPEEVETARANGQTPEQYALEKERLEKEGRIGPKGAVH